MASLLAVTLSGTVVTGQAPPKEAQPVIDVHIHALDVADFGPGGAVCADNRGIEWNGWDQRKPFDLGNSGTCAGTSWPSPKDDVSLLRETLAAFTRYNIVAAVTSGPLENVDKWRAAAPSLIIPAASFFAAGYDSAGRPHMRDIAELRQLVRQKRTAVFAEISQQYRGMLLSDPLLEPYFALAEELDIPVGIHMGEGPPGGANVEGYGRYRVALGPNFRKSVARTPCTSGPHHNHFQRLLGLPRKRARIRLLGDYWQKRLADVRGVSILTPSDVARSFGVASMMFDKIPSDKAVHELRARGFVLQDKSGRHSPYRNAIRVSSGVYASTSELDRFVTAVRQLAKA